MKRSANLFLAAIAAMFLGIAPVFGGDSNTYKDSNGVVWEFDYTYADNTATLRGVDTSSSMFTQVSVPSLVAVGTEEFTVTGVADGTFSGCPKTLIALPRTIKTITGQAFLNMGKTVYVEAPDTLRGSLLPGNFGTTDLKVDYYFTAQDIPLTSADFSKSQKIQGALALQNYYPWNYTTPFNGTVAELKFAKAGKAKNGLRPVKLAAVFTRRDGSKQRVKATLDLDANSSTTAPLKIHLKLDNSQEDDFYLSVANGKVTMDGTANGTAYKLAKTKIGGTFSSSISKLYMHLSPGSKWECFNNPDFFGAGWKLQDDLFHVSAITVQNGKKLVTPKGASFKLKRGKDGTYTITSNGGDDNKCALKLTYNAKTGQVKGSFKIYVLNAANTKLKSYTIKLFGIMLEDFVNGAATMKKPKGGPWFFWIDSSYGVG